MRRKNIGLKFLKKTTKKQVKKKENKNNNSYYYYTYINNINIKFFF